MSRMGQDDIRKLLIVGAMSRIRWICRRGPTADSWLGRLLLRKPRMVVAAQTPRITMAKTTRIWPISSLVGITGGLDHIELYPHGSSVWQVTVCPA